ARNAARAVCGGALQRRRDAARSSMPRSRASDGESPAMISRLIRLVSRLPATVHAKLLAAFLTIVVVLIIVGTVGLEALSRVNRGAQDLVNLQRKIAAYRQLQHDTTSQLYAVSAALVVPEESALDATLR